MVENELRRGDRMPLQADVDIRREKDFRYHSTLHDLSQFGCRVELVDRVDQGDRVWVGLPGLETLHSNVRWVSEWVAGIEFDRPIHPAVFDHVAARIQQARS